MAFVNNKKMRMEENHLATTLPQNWFMKIKLFNKSILLSYKNILWMNFMNIYWHV